MSGKLERARIGGADVAHIKAPMAVARARAISGARIYDVGQGDAIAILNEAGGTILQLDYGGRQDNPFEGKSRVEVDRMLPVSTDALVMVTHWDEDHWSTGPKGEAAKAVDWLVPRQVTSPRAVRFAADLAKVRCTPEPLVGRVFEYRAQNGDAILWQKIAKSSPSPSVHELQPDRRGGRTPTSVGRGWSGHSSPRRCAVRRGPALRRPSHLRNNAYRACRLPSRFEIPSEERHTVPVAGLAGDARRTLRRRLLLRRGEQLRPSAPGPIRHAYNTAGGCHASIADG